MTNEKQEEQEQQVRCYNCGTVASSQEEATDMSFCHVKMFDPRRLIVVGGDDNKDQQEETVGRLKDDGYYWLCPDCFHHIQETLLVVSGDLSDKFSNSCRQDLEKE